MPPVYPLYVGSRADGIIYADRRRLVDDDFARCAYLAYDTLLLVIEPDCPADLLPEITADATRLQARAGQDYVVTAFTPPVRLGSARPK